MGRRKKRQRPPAPATRATRVESAPPPGSRLAPAFVAVVAIAALVRLAATWNDLWLDEIWTLNLIGNLDSPLKIFTLRHDNNHILNSLFMYALRPLGIDWLYRVPDWLAGIATVGLGAWVASLGDGPEKGGDATPRTRALVAAILLGGSYLLVHYSSEARGYSLALAFGLLALGTALADGPRPMSRRAPVAWVSLVLAMLAFGLSVHFLVALVAWSAVRTLSRGGWRYAATALAWWYAVPVGAFAIFYLGFLRVMTIGGSPPEGMLAPIARAFGATTGLPDGVPAPLVLAFAIAVTAVGVTWLAACGSDLWTLYLVGIVLSPLAVALFHESDFYVARYFIVSATLWLLLAARLLARLTTRGLAARTVVALALAAFLLGNALRVVPLLQYGRGTFKDALRYMASRTPGETVRVASDYDFRNRMVVEYYAPRIGTDRPVHYVSRRDLTVPGPDWYIDQSSPRPGGAPSVVADARGNRYWFEIEFPSNPFLGMSWRLYRRAAPAGAARSPG